MSYAYDLLGELVRENNREAENESDWYTVCYTYDQAGNMLLKEQYPYSTEATLCAEDRISSIDYQYASSGWKDCLTQYGQTGQISYDAIGNPLQYRSGMQMTWTRGRQLSTLTDTKGTGSTEDDLHLAYTYDSNGIRTSKTVNGKTTKYALSGSRILALSSGHDVLTFIYDNVGSVLGFKTNNATYYYVKNFQGDVTGIIDEAGKRIVNYRYDAWGRPLETKVSGAEKEKQLSELNPFRYRSYAYDEETGLYYLNARYYDPIVGRFISADRLEILTAENNVFNKNVYAYCDNNPVSRVDDNGYFWNVVAGAFFGALISGVVDATAQYMETGTIDLKTLAVNMASGAISGAVAATGLGVSGQIAVNAFLGGGTYLAEKAVKHEKPTIVGCAVHAIIGGVSGKIGGKGLDGNKVSSQIKAEKKVMDRCYRRMINKSLAAARPMIKRVASCKIRLNGLYNSIKTAMNKFAATTVFNNRANAVAAKIKKRLRAICG